MAVGDEERFVADDGAVACLREVETGRCHGHLHHHRARDFRIDIRKQGVAIAQIAQPLRRYLSILRAGKADPILLRRQAQQIGRKSMPGP